MKLNFSIQQNTDEWDIIKLGKFSASISDSLLMDKKTAGYTKLIDKIIEERITKEVTESKRFGGNQFTERGHQFETEARLDYSDRTFNEVQIIGVIERDDWVLCSPDGLIYDDGLWQGKCPIFNTQRKYLKLREKHKALTHNEILKKLNSTYYSQMQFELMVSKRKYNVFTSYHPRLPALDLIIKRDNEMIDLIKSRLIEAKAEVTTEIEFLNNLM